MFFRDITKWKNHQFALALFGLMAWLLATPPQCPAQVGAKPQTAQPQPVMPPTAQPQTAQPQSTTEQNKAADTPHNVEFLYSASFKKFYSFMNERSLVASSDLQELKEEIKECLPDWMSGVGM